MFVGLLSARLKKQMTDEFVYKVCRQMGWTLKRVGREELNQGTSKLNLTFVVVIQLSVVFPGHQKI